MGQVQPAPVCLDGVRTFSVLHFLDGVIMTEIDDLLFLDDGFFHAVHQSPANAASVTGIDEAVLRAGVQGILAVYELGVQHHVALLAGTLDIRQALPVHQILGAGHAGGSRSGREVSFCVVVLALHAENAVNPAVLVGGKAHIIHIGSGLSPLGHRDGTRPEGEIVHAVGTFGHGKERLAVGSFYTHHQHILVFPLDGAGIKGGVNAETLHQVRVAVRIEVVAPLQRSMVGRQDGILVTLVHTVPLHGEVLSFNQLLVAHLEPLQTLFVSHNYRKNTICFSSLKAFISAAPS